VRHSNVGKSPVRAHLRAVVDVQLTMRHRGRDVMEESRLFHHILDDFLRQLNVEYEPTLPTKAYIHELEGDFSVVAPGINEKDAFSPAQILSLLESDAHRSFGWPEWVEVLFLVKGRNGLLVMPVGLSAWHEGKLCFNLVPLEQFGRSEPFTGILVLSRDIS